MKISIHSSLKNAFSTVLILGIISLMFTTEARTQCLVINYSQNTAGQNYIQCQQECSTQWQYCYVVNVQDGTFTVLTNVNESNLKVTKNNQALKAADIAKMPGMSKFKPFAGNDDVHMAIGPKLLTYQGHEGGAADRQLDLCQATDTDPCKSPSSWSISKDEKASGEAFHIQPSHDKNAYLCFSPGQGVTVHRNPAKTDDCIQWSIVPSQLGSDGEITGYKIFPKKHPEYLLAADTRSSQITIPKINTKHGEVVELEKVVMSDWTFNSNTVKKVINQKERVIEEAEEK